MGPDYYKIAYLQLTCKLNEEFELFFKNTLLFSRSKHVPTLEQYKTEILSSIQDSIEKYRRYGLSATIDYDKATDLIVKEYYDLYSLKSQIRRKFSEAEFDEKENTVTFEFMYDSEACYLVEWRDDNDVIQCQKMPEQKTIICISEGKQLIPCDLDFGHDSEKFVAKCVKRIIYK
jgi:hypothetical protein